MSVYVDPLFNTAPYRKSANERWSWKQSCHMVADTEEELHTMAQKLRLKPEWYQRNANPLRCHYDLTASKRALAVRYGAIEITTKQAGDRLRGISIDLTATLEQATLL